MHHFIPPYDKITCMHITTYTSMHQPHSKLEHTDKIEGSRQPGCPRPTGPLRPARQGPLVNRYVEMVR